MKTYCSKRTAFTLIETVIIIVIVGLMVAFMIPTYISAKKESFKRDCVSNLKRIRDVQSAWMTDKNRALTAIPTDADLFGPATPYVVAKPTCRAKGLYSLSSALGKPTCSIQGHSI